MGQGILPFVFEATPQPMDLTARAGLTLVSETMLALGLEDVVATSLRLRERERGYTEFDKLQALVLVQAAGGECVEDVRAAGRRRGAAGGADTRLPRRQRLNARRLSLRLRRCGVFRP